MEEKYIIDETFWITDGVNVYPIPNENKVLQLNDKTKEMIDEKLSLKNKVIWEISKPGFPDLEFLFSDEVLKEISSILEELLEEDNKSFDELLKKDLSEVTFEDLDESSNLEYLFGLVEHLDWVSKSDTTEQIIEDFEPKIIDFWNTQLYSKKFYDMHVAVLENCELDEEQTRIMNVNIDSFKRNWIDLPEVEQEKIKNISLELSKLSNDFTNNIVKEKGEFELHILDDSSLKEVPKEVLEIAKKAADKKWVEWYLFWADPTSYIALMEYCTDSNIRKQLSIDWNLFATNWDTDNRPLILKILKLKKEKANILGYSNFAEFNMTKKMAESPEQIFELLWDISTKAKEKANWEIKDLQDYYKLEDINSWDISFYSRKIKEDKYDVDEKEVKKYFEYNNVLTYLFEHIKNFYWVELKEIKVNSYNEDVKTYEVYKDWKIISYYFLDAFYRKEKRPWAWANNLRSKSIIDWNVRTPVVLNVCNFQKTESWDTLLSMRDAETLFHEFGHGIHEMLSDSKYSDLSWFNVEWDFVELPSQINENWVWERESLEKLAKHHETWEKISSDLLNKMDALKTFNSGLFVLRQNEFALTDMDLYTSDVPSNVEELDKKVLDFVNELSLFKKDENYKQYASFNHIFGWWYSAWYYSYMWAELLEADVFERIKEMWMFDKATWDKFVSTILGQWSKKPANELFKDFMWRDLDNTAFMKRKWLI